MCRRMRFIGLAVAVAASVSCGSVLTQGHSPVVLVMNSLGGAPGNAGTPGPFNGTLQSSVVVTTSPPCIGAPPCVVGDSGQALISLAMKNPTLQPTSSNQVTITRYRVQYVRADGQNTPGVDVPYPFDGAVTGTIIGVTPVPLTFDLVRQTAKEESPLAQLVGAPGVLYTIAYVTFYGQDLVGSTVSVTGSMSVNFEGS